MLPLTYIHGYAETARKGMVKGAISPPPTACRWLRINEVGARVAGVQEARLRPATGRRRALLRMCSKELTQ